jgi:hypothetical protein
MKNEPRVIYFFVFIFIILTSCNKGNPILNNEESSVSRKLTLKIDENFRVEANIFSIEPLVFVSNDLKVVKAIHSKTGKEVECLVIINNKSSNISAKLWWEQGWVFDNGSNCWVYGTIYHWSDGSITFLEADAATQYLLNECGWDNVA